MLVLVPDGHLTGHSQTYLPWSSQQLAAPTLSSLTHGYQDAHCHRAIVISALQDGKSPGI